jgi:Uncharacterized conserved protein
MKNHLFPIEEAENDLLKAAVFLAESISSSDGHAEAVKELVDEFLSVNDVDNAAALADTVEDPFVRDRLLVRVVDKCAEIDDDEYALQLTEAIEHTDFQAVARERLAIRKAMIGEFEKSLEFADALAHSSDALAVLAARQAAKGLEEEAAQTIERIDFPPAKVHAYLSIAAHHESEGGREKALAALDNAFSVARELEVVEERIRAFQDVAAHFSALSVNDRAIEALTEAQNLTETLDGAHRDAIFSSIALGFLRAGSLDLAERVLDLIADKVQIASTLAGYAQHFDENGEHEDALETLEEAYQILKSQSDREVRNSRERFDLLAEIAALFARFGKYERALEVAAENPFELARHTALRKISLECAVKGNDEAVREALNLIADESQRTFTLIELADVMHRGKRSEDALKYLEEARAAALNVPQLPSRSTALNHLIERFAIGGKTETAREIATENLQTITLIRDESARAVSLLHLANVFKKRNYEVSDEERKILQTMMRKTAW